MPKEILESRLDSFRLEDSCFSRFIYIHEARGQFSPFSYPEIVSSLWGGQAAVALLPPKKSYDEKSR